MHVLSFIGGHLKLFLNFEGQTEFSFASSLPRAHNSWDRARPKLASRNSVQSPKWVSLPAVVPLRCLPFCFHPGLSLDVSRSPGPLEVAWCVRDTCSSCPLYSTLWVLFVTWHLIMLHQGVCFLLLKNTRINLSKSKNQGRCACCFQDSLTPRQGCVQKVTVCPVVKLSTSLLYFLGKPL